MIDNHATEERQLRSMDHSANSVHVRNPLPSSSIQADSVIQWDAVPNRMFYHLTVLSEDGDVLTSFRTEETSWKLDSTLSLEQGAKYYVRIAAHLPDGKVLNSRHVEFRVEGVR